MNRSRGNISIKQMTIDEETGEIDTSATSSNIVNDSQDVQNVVQQMINNDSILDENDVKAIVDNKLTDYVTQTLLTNTLDNYTSKELLTQSLSNRPTFTTTDAITTTTTNHENRIDALEDNFVSKTSLTESLATKANSTHTHTMNDLTDYVGADLTGIEEDINELTEQVLAIEETLDDKANSTDLSNCAKLNTTNTFTETQTITTNQNASWGLGLKILDPSMDHNNKTIGISLGYGPNTNQCARISFVDYGADYSGNRLAFNVQGTERTLYVTGNNTIGIGYNTSFEAGLKTAILSLVYPVGSIYTSFVSTSPDTLFGFGTWEQIIDRFLYCSNSSGTTGGEATHKLTVNEMPSHNHTIVYRGWWTVGTSGSDRSVVAHNRTGDGDQNNGSLASYNSGGGQAHNNMPPYITVYCWKRTA